MLIDTHMSTYERQVFRARAIKAPKDVTLAAVRRVDFFQSQLIALPNRARVGFDRLVRASAVSAAPAPKRFGFEQLLEEDGGFRLLDEDENELVLGFVGRWWERGYGRVEWTPEEFAGLGRPGLAVGAWGFSVLGYGADASVLVTDVRVRCTDQEARAKFERYWRVVGPFVTAMARPVLRLVQREAELDT
jgi:hypothetical protein